MEKLVFLLFAFLVAVVTGQPGMKLRINQPGVDFISDLTLEVVEEESEGFPFSDIISVEVGTSLSQNFSITGLTLYDVDFEEASLTPSPPNGLILIATSISASISGDYNIDFRFFTRYISSDGSFDAELEGLSIIVILELQENDGQFSSVVSMCQPQINSLDIEFDEDATELTKNMFAPIARNDIIPLLEQELCSGLSARMNFQLNEFLGRIDTRYSLAANISVDFSLWQDPSAGNDYFDVDFNGQCSPDAQPDVSFPYTRGNPPNPTDTDLMGHILVGSYVIETFVHSLFLGGVFNTEVDLRTLNIPLVITTSSLSAFIPELARIYGSNRPINFRTQATFAPEVALDESEITVTGGFDVITLVVREDETTSEAFTLSANVTATGNVIVENAIISASVTDITFQVDLKESNIGEVNIGVVQFFIRGALNSFILPAINGILGNGIELPSAFGFNFENVQVYVQEGGIELIGDLAEAD